MSYQQLFKRFLADQDRLHFAAHSHHPWPDVTYEAHVRWWEDSARLMDDKWDQFFAQFLPTLRRRLGDVLGLGEGSSIAFAPNTHELVNRLVSAFDEPLNIVSTDAEFHSFNRQSRRWEEAGKANVIRVPAEPFSTFTERFLAAAPTADLVYLSQVFFDSGYVVDMTEIVGAIPDRVTVAIDGYHGFMARPTDLTDWADRIFYLAGGYKYAMAGEGACFMHCPESFPRFPVDTGWYAGFGSLTGAVGEVGFASGGDRFWGATQDGSGLYRLEAVLALLDQEAITPATVQSHVGELQDRFLDSAPHLGELIPERSSPRGSFLTFRRPDAADVQERLHRKGVITDYRQDRWRVGFGIYHAPEDVDRLLTLL